MATGPLQQRLHCLAEQGWQALAGAVRIGVGTLEELAAWTPSPVAVAELYYDLAEEVLRVQRAVVLDVLRITLGESERRADVER